jgi:hypothetical protein
MHVQCNDDECAYRQYLASSQAGNNPFRLDNRHWVPAAVAAAASIPAIISSITSSNKEGLTIGCQYRTTPTPKQLPRCQHPLLHVNLQLNN